MPAQMSGAKVPERQTDKGHGDGEETGALRRELSPKDTAVATRRKAIIRVRAAHVDGFLCPSHRIKRFVHVLPPASRDTRGGGAMTVTPRTRMRKREDRKIRETARDRGAAEE